MYAIRSYYASLNPHIVVMDITMPRLNGIDATRLILKQHPAIRVIALSNSYNFV